MANMKRKNDHSSSNRERWIFGILALVLLYPILLMLAWNVMVSPTMYISTTVAPIGIVVWCMFHRRIADESKLKNNEVIPNRYWWIFGILAIVLVIGLRFPVRILTVWTLNPLMYSLLEIGCLVFAGYIITRYGWKRQLVALILFCSLLSCWQVFVSARQGSLNNDFCTVEYGLITRYRCSYIGNCPTLLRDYATLGNLPIGIELLDYYDNPCGYPRIGL